MKTNDSKNKYNSSSKRLQSIPQSTERAGRQLRPQCQISRAECINTITFSNQTINLSSKHNKNHAVGGTNGAFDGILPSSSQRVSISAFAATKVTLSRSHRIPTIRKIINDKSTKRERCPQSLGTQFFTAVHSALQSFDVCDARHQWFRVVVLWHSL